MTTLRLLLARGWANVWVRAQLVRARLDRRSRVPGPDYHLAEHEAPREGVDYAVLEIPPDVAGRLDAVRDDLGTRAERQDERRHRRRHVRRGRAVAVATSMLLGVAIMGAGASAVIGGSTGVPEVDRLLGIREEAEKAIDESGGVSDPTQTPQPKPGSSSVTVELEDNDGKLIETAYLNRADQICSALVRAGGAGIGSTACAAPAAIAERLADRSLFVTGVSPGKQTTLSGYASEDVRSVAVRGPDGAFRVELSEPWKSGAPGLPRLRGFLAVGPTGATGEALRPQDLQRVVDPATYEITVRLDDGRLLDVKP